MNQNLIKMKKIHTWSSICGKRDWRWSIRDGRERRIGEEEQRSLLETGGDGGRSSKKDLLVPHTAADIVQNCVVVIFCIYFFFPIFFFFLLWFFFLYLIVLPQIKKLNRKNWEKREIGLLMAWENIILCCWEEMNEWIGLDIRKSWIQGYLSSALYSKFPSFLVYAVTSLIFIKILKNKMTIFYIYLFL
jgi:hypothetical protein